MDVLVDRQARDIAADLVARFMNGLITNDEYERQYPRNPRDPALRAVHHGLWSSYSDLRIHRLTGKYALTTEGRAMFERCCCFLKSDLEFKWPMPEISLKIMLLKLTIIGWWLLRRKEERATKLGDPEVWPFLAKSDYEAELARQAQQS